MLTVAILVNGNPIMARSATNTGRAITGKIVYQVDDGSEILHDPEEGAVRLAVMLLGTIREQGVETEKAEKSQPIHRPTSTRVRCPVCGDQKIIPVNGSGLRECQNCLHRWPIDA